MQLADTSMAVISIEGLRLPVATAIDTFGFVRFDYDRDGHALPSAADRTYPAQAILRDGSVVHAVADDLPWHDLIAYRPQEGRAARCDCCEEFIGFDELWERGGLECCESCASCGDWG